MSNELPELRNLLLEGIRLSQQGSYQRRAPAQKARPYLISARDRLQQFVTDNPRDVEGWRLLSQAQECLLAYRDAISSLEKSLLVAGTGDRRDLRRLALLRQAADEWSQFPLTLRQIENLGQFLLSNGAHEEPQGRSMRWTKQWLIDNHHQDPTEVINAFSKRGAYTDFQVFHNVVHG
ncbi:MAG: DUF2695 domain-containing protein [Planctomycetes bacterium]|nr:DUF2695 domain-containing protein [Planctomycetota bacterium]